MKEHTVKTRTLTIAAIAAGLACSATAHTGEPEHAVKTIEVAPVREAAAANAILERERGDLPQPKLTIGMKAPKLAVADWVKGDSVQGFEKDHTYIVEFWATWCGPCVRAFPHVSEVQAKHKDELTVIGVNIWDRKKDRATGEYKETMPELIERVHEFVGDQGDKMSYTVAIEESDKMAENWMKAAGQNGIPAAFIVDKAGKVAWVGHPMSIDKPLEEVLAGKWDIDAAKKEQIADMEAGYWYPHTMGLIADEKTAERGYQLAYALLRSPIADNPGMLNAMSWNMLTNDKVAVRDYKAAVALASVACEKTEWKDPSVIDTLARGYYDMGDHAKAVELQSKAVKLAEGTPMAEDLAETLEHYKTGGDD
jgi:thiol-disulfide isomerase/thioredoxin